MIASKKLIQLKDYQTHMMKSRFSHVSNLNRIVFSLCKKQFYWYIYIFFIHEKRKKKMLYLMKKMLYLY
jgi:hypothetical protein